MQEELPSKKILKNFQILKVIIKKLPGQIEKIPIDEEETFLRQNFTESDNRNYRDGDIESTRFFSRFGGESEDDESNKRPESTAMYDAPTPTRSRDDDGNIIFKITSISLLQNYKNISNINM